MRKLIHALTTAALTIGLLATASPPAQAADPRCAPTTSRDPLRLTYIEDHTPTAVWPIRCAGNFLNHYTQTSVVYLNPDDPIGGHCAPIEPPCAKIYERVLPHGWDSLVCPPIRTCLWVFRDYRWWYTGITTTTKTTTIYLNPRRATQTYEYKLRMVEHALAQWRVAPTSTSCDLMFRTVVCRGQLVRFVFGADARIALHQS
jgi:hypothetical protein